MKQRVIRMNDEQWDTSYDIARKHKERGSSAGIRYAVEFTKKFDDTFNLVFLAEQLQGKKASDEELGSVLRDMMIKFKEE